MLFAEKSVDGSRFIFFVRKVKKSGTRTPWNSRRWFLDMGKIELIDTGRLTEKQARLNMERCAECKFCSNGTPILKLAVHPF